MDTASAGSTGIDPLTGLRNRSHLDLLETSFGSRIAVWSLIILDVDHFKLINDIYGHLTGDDVLRQVARTIQVSLKASDVPIRFGGDEFIIVLPDTTGEGAMNLAERLMNDVGRLGNPSGLRVSLSMGISQSRDSDATIADMIERADKALYQAKEKGRGRFFLFSEGLKRDGLSDISFSHMVGRRPELSKLRQLLDESVADAARLALVTGEAGVGKNRLLDELLHYCRFRKVTVERSMAFEHVRHQPYELVVQPLQSALAQLDEAALLRVRQAVEPVHPATLELFPGIEASVMDDTLYFRDERLRFRIFRDVAALYAAVSAISPMAVILDNMQWAPEPDLDMLSYVIRNTSSSRLLFVCLLRRNDDEPGVFQKLLSLRSSIPVLHIELGHLTAQESRNMILFALKDPNVPDALQEFLIRQSGGNPLFLRELVLSLVSSGTIVTSPSGEKAYNFPHKLEIPESMGQIISSRLAQVDEQTRNVLRIASLSPENLTLGLLESVVGGDPTGLAEKLDTSVKLGLLAETMEPGGEVGFSFAHGAVQEFLRRELSESLKQTHHQRIARYLEGLHLSGRDDLLSTVAYHFTRSRDAAKGAEYSLKAAERACSMGANRHAISWFLDFLERAGRAGADRKALFLANLKLGMLFVITSEAGKADTYLKKALELADGAEELAAVEFGQGRSCHQRSRFPEAMDHFVRTVTLCDECTGSDPLVTGTSVDARLAISFICRLRGEYETAFQWLDSALDLLVKLGRDVRQDLWALYHIRRADVLSERGEGEEALRLYDLALDLCAGIGDLTGESMVLNNMHGSYSNTGDYERAMQTLERVVDLTRRLDDRLGLAIAYYNIAEHFLELNGLSSARVYYGKYMELSREIGNLLGLGFGHFGLGFLNQIEGNAAGAEACYKRALEVFEELECAEPMAGCRLRLAAVLVQSGNLEGARKQLEKLQGHQHPPSTESEILHVKGMLMMSEPDAGPERLKEAARFIRDSVSGLEQGHNAPEAAQRYTTLARALTLCGDAGKTREALLEGCERIAGELGQVRSAAARNSIMGRAEIKAFLGLLAREGLDFPPPGREFPPD